MKVFLESVAARLNAVFDLAHAGEKFADILTSVIVAALTFLVFYLAWRLMSLASGIAFRRSSIDSTTRSFVYTLSKYGILTFGTVQALTALGVNTPAILASLGVAGLTIGFAAQATLSNIISGFLIFWDRPFVIGDLVEVGTYYGRVDRITLRSTRVVTSDGRMLAVPNSDMVNTTVASYTNFPTLRLDIDVNVGVGEDLGKARDLLLGLVESDVDYLKEPAPRVVVTALNDYNVALQLQAWIKDERRHVAKRFELREKAFVALTAAGVEMPFEILQLTPLEVTLEPQAA